jgi:hypothetical protein
MGDDEKKTSLESATALAESITKFLAATKSAENESTSEAPPTEAADAASWVWHVPSERGHLVLESCCP